MQNIAKKNWEKLGYFEDSSLLMMKNNRKKSKRIFKYKEKKDVLKQNIFGNADRLRIGRDGIRYFYFIRFLDE